MGRLVLEFDLSVFWIRNIWCTCLSAGVLSGELSLREPGVPLGIPPVAKSPSSNGGDVPRATSGSEPRTALCLPF